MLPNTQPRSSTATVVPIGAVAASRSATNVPSANERFSSSHFAASAKTLRTADPVRAAGPLGLGNAGPASKDIALQPVSRAALPARPTEIRMNLNTITEIKRPRSADEIRHWQDGYAWLAGGTWLFSEPQIHTDTLVDLETLGWQAIALTPSGIEFAATCKIAELYAFRPPAEWKAGPLFGECCRAFLSSFKIWNEATIGGNIVMSLPAGPMISLTVALEATYALLAARWRGARGPCRRLRHRKPRKRARTRRAAPQHPRSRHGVARNRSRSAASELTHLGRSSVLLIGTRGEAGGLLLTVTAATVKPVQLPFRRRADGRTACAARSTPQSPSRLYLDDVHGSPAHRRHLTYHFAEQIRQELGA